METILKITIAAVLLSFVSCSKIYEEPSHNDNVVFTATNVDAMSTKTIRKEDGSVNWLAYEDINLFYGNSFSAKFSSNNSEEASQVNFSGSLSGIEYKEEDYFVAIYPYKSTHSFDGTNVIVTLPNKQTGVKMSFADDLFLSIAKTKDKTLRFYNVCGGVMFSVPRSDIKSITFKGNNNEVIAGNAVVAINDKTGYPEIVDISFPETMITVSAPSTYFEADTYYYIVAFPSELPSGYTISYSTDTGDYIEKVEKNVQIKRSVFGKLSMAGPDIFTFVGDYTISSKTQLEQFAEKGYKRISGNLTISGEELTTISKLDNTIEEIEGSLTIDCSSLTTLDGLYGIKVLKGSLIINNHSLSDLEGLNNLEIVNGSIRVNKLPSFKGLDKLSFIGNNFEITDASSFNGLNGVSRIGGDLIIKNGSFNSFSGLDNLSRIEGSFELISTAEKYESDCIVLDMDNLQNFGGLSSLSYVGGDFSIRADASNNYLPNTAIALPALKDFSGLENLREIGGSFIIYASARAYRSYFGASLISLPSLSSFAGLDNLTSIGRDFRIEAFTYGVGNQYTPSKANASILLDLSSLDGLNSLTTIGGSIIIKSSQDYDEYSKSYMRSSSLTSLQLSGLHNLSRIGNNVIIEKGTNFNTFDNLSYLGGGFYCSTSVSGVDKLTSIPSSVQIIGSITGMNNVISINGNVTLSSPQITGFCKLTSMNGDLTITNATNLIGLSKLSKGIRNVNISSSPNLFDFTPLISAAGSMTGTWDVSGCGYNPTKYQMQNGQAKKPE